VCHVHISKNPKHLECFTTKLSEILKEKVEFYGKSEKFTLLGR